ncbi:MAG: exo-alpha-sialidase [Candidatus Aminicenantes bacterium]|nr:exo-alpha-sialidase [Candidatus Aminicenantes bacterium]
MTVQSIVGKIILALSLSFFVFLSYACTPGKQEPESTLTAENISYVVSPNLKISDEELNECWIAVSPKNPDILLATAQTGNMEAASLAELRHCRLFLSRDGGNTWELVTLPEYAAGAFDPQVAADPEGRMYVVYGMIGKDMFDQFSQGYPLEKSTIYVWSTPDEGKTWEGPTPLDCPVRPDHPRILVIANGPYKGRVVIGWNDVKEDKLFFNYSTDYGKTFSKAVLAAKGMEPGYKYVATDPVMLSDGTLIQSFFRYYIPPIHSNNDTTEIYMVRSEDGGDTWSEKEVVVEFGPYSWKNLIGEIDAFPNPMMVSDTHKNSPFKDHIYLIWDDVHEEAARIWLMRSTDTGKSWSEPMVISDNPGPKEGEPADFRNTPAINVNNEGSVGVVWYDRRQDPAKICWRYMMAVSEDGGATFSKNFPVSSEASCPPADFTPLLKTHDLYDDKVKKIPEEQLEKMGEMERLMHDMQEVMRQLQKEATADLTSPQIKVTYNKARSLSIGHYTGLTSDAHGTFHPLWIDSRSGRRQLYTSQVSKKSEWPAELKKTDVSDRIKIVPGKIELIPGSNRVNFTIQIQNMSEQTIYGPILLLLAEGGISGTAGVNSNYTEDGRLGWSVSKELGTQNCLHAKQISEPITVVLEIEEKTKADATVDFNIYGQLKLPAADR